MNYAKDHALPLETSYPYTHVTGKCKSMAGIVKTLTVNSGKAQSIPDMKAAIEKGPTSVCVRADPPFR
jgi:hypothetical protein